MSKVPSYLKGLAETRARVAAEVGRLTATRDEVVAKLAKARVELKACDLLIRKFDERLNPGEVTPVRAWKGRYGKRGALRSAVVRHLRERSPAAVTTSELSLAMQVQFQLEFALPKDRGEWQINSLTRLLKRLVAQGLVERMHDASVPCVEVGRWRWVGGDTGSLDNWQEAADAFTANMVLPRSYTWG